MATKKTNLEKRIERLEADLKNAKAQKSKQNRKERNRQLIALGIFIEQKYKKISESEREEMKKLCSSLLDGRNLKNATEGFKRLDESN